MRSSSIYYRVADFLKEFPPFSFVGEEDLLRLAGSGRVKFHASDEYVYWQGHKPGRFIFVIQQGTLKLVDENHQAEVLQDVLGEGDIIGAERLAGKSEYQYSAKTTSDVIIYALLATEFEGLAERYPRFARYIESNFSVAPADISGKSTDGAATGSGGACLPVDFLARRMLTCAGGTPLQEAVERMSRHGRDTIVVTKNGAPAGYLNDTSFRRLVAGDIGGAGGVAGVMATPLALLSDELPPHAYAMEMLRGGCSAVGIMDSKGALKAVVTESDLTLPRRSESAAARARDPVVADACRAGRTAAPDPPFRRTVPHRSVGRGVGRRGFYRVEPPDREPGDRANGGRRRWPAGRQPVLGVLWSRGPRRAAHRGHAGCRPNL